MSLHLFSLIPHSAYCRGIYREILFLTMAALGKDHVDIGKGASASEGIKDMAQG